MRNARNSWKVYKADALLHTNATCNINKIQLYCTASQCTIVSVYCTSHFTQKNTAWRHGHSNKEDLYSPCMTLVCFLVKGLTSYFSKPHSDFKYPNSSLR